MEDDIPQSTTDILDIGDINSEYFSLRIGQVIPRLEIAKLKRITNPSKSDNLPGTDYKYVLEDTEGRALVINSWALWRRISSALRTAGTVQTTLELKHPAVEDYRVRALSD